MAPSLRPVPDRPALLLRRGGSAGSALLVADVHLGLGAVAGSAGGPPGASAEAMALELLDIARRHRARQVIVAGDAKHPIVGTPPSLRPVVFDFFSTLLADGLEVDLVPGNHDVGLARYLPREVRLHSPAGLVTAGVGVFHGHRWPSDRVLAADRLVVGHLHPGVRLAPSADNPTGKRPCWVRAELTAEARGVRRRPLHGPLLAREVVVLPAFHPLAGIESLNRERPRRGRSFLFQRFLARGRPRAYLLDGTDLGPLASAGQRP